MSSKGLKSTKRKDNESSEKPDALKSKKPKLSPSNPTDKKHNPTIQNQKPGGGQHAKPKSFGNNDKSGTLSKKERRVQAKVLLKNLIFFFSQSFKTFEFGIYVICWCVWGGCRSWQKQGRRGGSLITLSSKYVPL